ncbi:TonB-dependent receptor [Alteromonas pelagimontana]|uniref:TonB-dependent receptor n=1 Tax=Alteromonas pelagimontana TaxID=1858656 RepID=A0A6M4MFJ6_9ALTE|nr:TonB-dependent receptor [Alteromonas pelagimontana]QJR81924.1 TonB-dependent receptor [Alteromonas pelagimontana]
MKSGIMFNKSVIATHVFAAMYLALSAQNVYAQESTDEAASEDDIEVIDVKGFRGSLVKALDAKRDAANVRDSIMAEDIGKFPDLNVAEAIQRVPGVAISREGGEGRNITLRGFSPGFTRTTLNGMEVPAGSDGLDSGGVTVNSSRAFDFNVFASELFNRIDIQKTQTASIEEGGIAGTVDMYSARPFDSPGFLSTISAKAGYNDLTEKVDPRMAFLISNTFADDTLGALFSVAISDRTVRQEGFGSVRWQPTNQIGDGTWGDTSQLTTINGTPSDYCGAEEAISCLWVPRLPRADFFGNDQKRIGVTTSLQYKPSDDMLFTLDVLHSELENDRRNYNSMEWLVNRDAPGDFQGQTPLSMTVDETGKILIAGEFDNVTSWYESRYQVSDSTFDQYVLSGDIQLSDTLLLDVMAGFAKNDADREEIRYYYRSVPHYYAYDYSNGDGANVSYGDYDMTDPDNYVDAVNASNRNDRVKKTNYTAKIDLQYLGDRYDIKTGLAFNDREVDYQTGDGVFTAFDPSQYSRPFPYSDFGSGLDVTLVPFLVADFDKLEQDGILTHNYTPNTASSWVVGEKTTALYLEYNGDVDIADMLLRTNFGVRYVNTEVTSEALVGDSPVSVQRDYNNFLPSMNLALEVTDDVIARLSYARSMTRPNLGSLNIASPVFGYTTFTVSNLGNPGLNPYESNDVDMGLEWYFDEEAMLAVNIFNKEIVTSLDTEIVEKLVEEEFWPVIYADPQYQATAPLGDPAVQSYTHNIPVNNNDGFSVKGYEVMYQQPFTFFDRWLSNFGVVANYTHVSAEDSTGLSPNSYNFTLYYEEEDYGARVSVNKRDDYLLSEPGGNGHAQERKFGPTHVDFSSFYNFSEQLTFSFEIINLTDEIERIYGTGDGDMDLTREFSHTGTQYFVGARYTF